jgi:hypothetical protein
VFTRRIEHRAAAGVEERRVLEHADGSRHGIDARAIVAQNALRGGERFL